MVDSDLVPTFLDKYSYDKTLISEYQVLGSASSATVNGAPTITIRQPKYDGADRSLSLPLRVDTLRVAEDVVPDKDDAVRTGRCIQRWHEVAFPQLALHFEAQGKFIWTNQTHIC